MRNVTNVIHITISDLQLQIQSKIEPIRGHQ